MKSMPGRVGNVKMNGKKHKLMSCGCCECQDFRDNERKKEALKEIRDYGSVGEIEKPHPS